MVQSVGRRHGDFFGLGNHQGAAQAKLNGHGIPRDRGPGLFIRIKNGWPSRERLEILRWADYEVTRIIKKAGIYQDVSQLVVGLPCGLSVGVKGDERAYAYEIVVRGVKTIDFMTAEGYQFPADVRREITTTLTRHKQIVAVTWNETPKPPATVELE